MIYKFKMITGRKDGFQREYEIYSDSTLYDLHRHIQDDLDFDEAQMAAFYTSDPNWKEYTQYALFDMGNGAMDSIVLEDLINNKIKHLVYTFDFFNNRSLLLEFLGEAEPEARRGYPQTTESKGNPPDQIIDRPVTEPLLVEDPLWNKKNVPDPVDDDFDNEEDSDEDDDDNALDDSDLDMLSESDDV